MMKETEENPMTESENARKFYKPGFIQGFLGF